MNRFNFSSIVVVAVALALLLPASYACADFEKGGEIKSEVEAELSKETTLQLEGLLSESNNFEAVEGYASHYARRFEGRRTTSGQRYNPDKFTAAHESLPLGTVVRVVNLVSREEVLVTVNDRCASRSFHFIDLSRAAAKKIGLWGNGKIKVEIIPL